MPWKETSSGRYERSFNSLERCYRTISAAGAALNRDHYAITAVARLRLGPSIGDSAKALRQAWRTLRYDFPLIAAYGQGDTYIYEVPSTSALDSWLKETFIIEPPTSSTTGMYGEAVPTELARMHYFPHTSEVLFSSSHWRIDGIGSLHLLNHFLHLLAYPGSFQFGDEGKNLLIGLDEATGAVSEATPEMEEAATELLMKYVNNLPTIGLPASLDRVPCGSGRCGISFTPQATCAVVAKCKTLGFSVTTAVHAAMVCATSQHPNPSATQYTSWVTWDLRRHLPSPYNGATNAVSNFHTGVPVIVKPSTFLENAAQLRICYSEKLTAPGPRNMLPFLSCYTEKVTSVLMQPPPPGVLPPTDPTLMSLGVLDAFLDSKHGDVVEVNDFWLGVDVLTPQLMVYVWTLRGKMQLSACYNKSYYVREFVEEFLGQVKHVLLEGLEIQSDHKT